VVSLATQAKLGAVTLAALIIGLPYR